MSDEALRIVEPHSSALPKYISQCLAFLGIPARGPRRMGADYVYLFSVQPAAPQCQANALRLPLRVWKDKIGGIGVHRIANDLAVDRCSPAPRIAKSFEYIDTAPFGDNNPIAMDIEGARGAGRILMRCERSLTVKARKNSEGVDAFARSPGKGDVAFIEAEHLGSLDEPRVPRRTRRTDRVVRSSDSHVQRDLASRVIGDSPRIMVMRPVVGVVVVPLDFVDLIFRFDIPVLGHSDINADSRSIEFVHFQPGMGNRFTGRIDADTSGPCSTSDVSLGLVLGRWKIADTGERFSEVPDLVRLHSTAALEQGLAKFIPSVSVGRGEANPRDDNSLIIRERAGTILSDHV